MTKRLSIVSDKMDSMPTVLSGGLSSFETGVHVVEKSGQIISGELQAANGYHDLDHHPAVSIQGPFLKSECKFSQGGDTR